jgi:hypothetical protein
VKNYFGIITIFICLFIQYELKGQDNSMRPQLWNNLYLVKNVSEKPAVRNALVYNVLLSKGYPWNEYSYSGAVSYDLKPWFNGSTGLYLASTRQSENLRSTEIRPYLGIRLSTKANKRWLIANISRMEWRNIMYSKGGTNVTFRFRNRIYAAISLIQKTLNTDHNLSLFSYFEAFHNFDNDVVERFFTQYKCKLGVVYRHNYSWRFYLGLIYQEAKNNVQEIGNLPVNLITNYILDWGIAYIIPPKKK